MQFTHRALIDLVDIGTLAVLIKSDTRELNPETYYTCSGIVCGINYYIKGEAILESCLTGSVL